MAMSKRAWYIRHLAVSLLGEIHFSNKDRDWFTCLNGGKERDLDELIGLRLDAHLRDRFSTLKLKKIAERYRYLVVSTIDIRLDTFERDINIARLAIISEMSLYLRCRYQSRQMEEELELEFRREMGFSEGIARTFEQPPTE